MVTIVGHLAVPLTKRGDKVTALSMDPETGDMYALLKYDGSEVNDRLYRIDADTGELLEYYGELKSSVNGTVLRIRNAEEMEFAAGGRLLIADDYNDKLYEVDPENGEIIALLDNNLQDGFAGSTVKLKAMAYDFVSDTLLGVDDSTDELATLTLENGNNSVVVSLGNYLSRVVGIDFVPHANFPSDPPITITWPTNQMAECPYDGNTLLTGEPIISGDVVCTLISTNSDTVSSFGCSDVWTRVWTVFDSCGRERVSTQTVTVVDTTKPVLSGVLGNVTVECDAVPSVANVTALDSCEGSVAVDFSAVTNALGCANGYSIVRTWSATDSCGNTVEDSRTITVEDTTRPVLSANPPSVTVGCWFAVPDYVPITATDVCDPSISVQYTAVTNTGSCANEYSVTRTYTAADDCGNSTSHVQVITVNDTTGPDLDGVPADVTVECASIPSVATVTGNDGCDGNVSVSFSAVTNSLLCGNSYTITRTWIAVDGCGNDSEESQVITVQDTTDPILSGVPGNTTVDCDGVPPATNLVTASDNCDSSVDVVFGEVTTPGNCDNSYTITRTWTATDDCNNQAVGTQIITVGDTTAPVFSNIPSNESAECDSIPGLPVAPTATDSCDASVEVVLAITTNMTCDYTYDLYRVWTATDDCGNSASVTQVVAVADTTAPTVVCQNAIEMLLGTPLPTLTATVTDSCDPNAGIVEQSPAAGFIYGSGVHTVTLTGSDTCGNETDCTVTVTVVGPATVGDFVWVDGILGFEDGVWNEDPEDEPGYEGVSVALYDVSENLISNVVTDASGFYQFQAAPGTYYIKFTAPGGTSFTTQGAGSDDTLDSDANASGRTANFTLIADGDNPDVDAGLLIDQPQ